MNTSWKFIGVSGLAFGENSRGSRGSHRSEVLGRTANPVQTTGYFGANKGVPGAYQSPLVRGNPLFPWEGLDRRA